MPERISGSALYVTHELMNRYLSAIIGGGFSMVLSVVGATWYLSEQIADVRQDVAVVKVRIEGLSTLKPASAEAQQSQYVLVQVPRGESESFQEQVKAVLAKQGSINGAP